MQLASLQFMRRIPCSGRSATRQIVSQHLSQILSKKAMTVSALELSPQ
jgi:hypothetical protein